MEVISLKGSTEFEIMMLRNERFPGETCFMRVIMIISGNLIYNIIQFGFVIFEIFCNFAHLIVYGSDIDFKKLKA